MCRLKSNFTGGWEGVLCVFCIFAWKSWAVRSDFIILNYEPRYFTTILMHNNSKIFNKDNQLGRAKIVGARSSRYSWLPLAGPFVEVETRVSQGWSNYILQAQARPGLDISTSIKKS